MKGAFLGPQVADNLPLYGVCCYMDEIIHRPPQLLRYLYPNCKKPLSRYLVSAPRCYCFLTHYPFFSLHLKACFSFPFTCLDHIPSCFLFSACVFLLCKPIPTSYSMSASVTWPRWRQLLWHNASLSWSLDLLCQRICGSSARPVATCNTADCLMLLSLLL